MITLGGIGIFVIGLIVNMLVTFIFGKTAVRFIRWRDTFLRIAIGFGLCLFGWIAAWLHLLIFDPMYLRRGSLAAFRRQKTLGIEK